MDAALANPPFSLLPSAIQKRVVQEMREALPADKARAEELRAQLAALETHIANSVQFLSFFPQEKEPVNATAHKPESEPAREPVKPAEGYQRSWTQPQKLLYVLKQPLAYGNSPTHVTNSRVVDAVFVEEPELLQGDAEDTRRRLLETLSKLVTQRGVVPQMREKGTKGPLHYISPAWFENGLPKPEYAEILANLEPAPIERRPRKATAPANAGAEDSTSTVSPVEEDANPDTDEVNPPVDKAKEQNRLQTPAELFLTS